MESVQHLVHQAVNFHVLVERSTFWDGIFNVLFLLKILLWFFIFQCKSLVVKSYVSNAELLQQFHQIFLPIQKAYSVSLTFYQKETKKIHWQMILDFSVVFADLLFLYLTILDQVARPRTTFSGYLARIWQEYLTGTICQGNKCTVW